MKVNFVIRQTKKKNDGCVPIEMTICVKGKRRYVSTGREVKPSDFNSKTQTVKGAIIRLPDIGSNSHLLVSLVLHVVLHFWWSGDSRNDYRRDR